MVVEGGHVVDGRQRTVAGVSSETLGSVAVAPTDYYENNDPKLFGEKTNFRI